MTTRPISASALNSLDQCSYSFYLSRYLKLPERVWERTSVGTAAHSLLECLRRPKHRAALDLIKGADTIYAAPSVARLARTLKAKYSISDTLMADIDPMVMLVIRKTDYLDEGADEIWDPEHEFDITLTGGAAVRGVIDRMARRGGMIYITDYKSQRNRFTASELRDGYQAKVYQLYAWKRFGLPATVTFVQLRHPPTTRTPDKHLQVVPPATPDQLAGFEAHLDGLYPVFQHFGLPEAYESFCTDVGFCRNVCSYHKPFDYWHLARSDGTFATYSLDKAPHQPYDGVLTQRTYLGCPKFNTHA